MFTTEQAKGHPLRSCFVAAGKTPPRLKLLATFEGRSLHLYFGFLLDLLRRQGRAGYGVVALAVRVSLLMAKTHYLQPTYTRNGKAKRAVSHS